MREVCVGFIEDQREVGPRKRDRVHFIAVDLGMGKGRETTVLFFRALSVAKQLRVDVVDQVHFVWPGSNKLHMLQQPEESRFDRIAGPEDRNPPCSRDASSAASGSIMLIRDSGDVATSSRTQYSGVTAGTTPTSAPAAFNLRRKPLRYSASPPGSQAFTYSKTRAVSAWAMTMSMVRPCASCALASFW